MDTPEDVAAWVANHEREHGNGMAGLRSALARGIISGRNATVARAWLDEQEHGDRRRAEAEQLDLARRSTAASEVAAKAAVDSARHAGVSALWAKIAGGVAALALIVSAWPQVQQWLASASKPLPTAATAAGPALSSAASAKR